MPKSDAAALTLPPDRDSASVTIVSRTVASTS